MVVEPRPAAGDVHRSGAGAALAGALARKPGAQTRPGQEAMCAAVEAALAGAGHLLVEAPTGTGKSLAYLVPAIRHALSGEDRTVVVVTATKALQEQLVGEDLPFLASALEGPPFDFAMLKGRSNYLCWAKLEVTQADGVEGRLDFGAGGPMAALERVAELGAWAGESATGDRADVPGAAVSDAVWSQVSVDPGECPGAAKCHAGDRCFAETARARAAGADIVVVNAHLYASHLASGGYVLPPHDAVVFDEAHTLEDVFAEALGVRLSAGRVRRVASRLRGAGADVELARRLERAAGILDDALSLLAGTEPTRITPTEGDLAQALGVIGTLAGDAAGALRRLAPAGDAARAKVAQAGRLVDGLAGGIVRLLDPDTYANQVAWVETYRDRPELHLAIIDVGPVLAAALYPKVTVVATSATLATGGRFDGLARRLGLSLPPPVAAGPGAGPDADPDSGEERQVFRKNAEMPAPPRFSALAVASPFDHPRQGFLYVARHLPEPNDPAFSAAMHEELHALIAAAGGRTLALFTSRAAMERAADALAGRDGYEIVVQDRLPRPELLARFRSGPGLALFATQSFWQGVDLPGSLCHLVTIDRLPFPRPTDPLVQARREAAEARGANAFAAVDVPLAATLLAQGAGRLIRTTTDRGVVAVFDRRLATRSYRATLLATMPPLRRTVDRDQVLATLTGLRHPG